MADAMLSALARGDFVITNGGAYTPRWKLSVKLLRTGEWRDWDSSEARTKRQADAEMRRMYPWLVTREYRIERV